METKQGKSAPTQIDAAEAITLLMQQVNMLNSKIEDAKPRAKRTVKKADSGVAAVMDKKILTKAHLLYYYDIRDNKVAWAETVMKDITGIVQQNELLWNLLDKTVPIDVTKKLVSKHFDNDLPKEVRENYLAEAKVQIQAVK